jgi:predicted small integral membrane protein
MEETTNKKVENSGAHSGHRPHHSNPIHLNTWLIYIILSNIPIFNLFFLSYQAFIAKKLPYTIKTFSKAYILFTFFVILSFLVILLYFQLDLSSILDCLKYKMAANQIEPEILIID